MDEGSGLFGLWLRFGSVTGFFKPAPSPKPRQKPKIPAAHRYIFSVNALGVEIVTFPSPSRHGAMTWVTLEGIDIGYTLELDLWVFPGHALEIYFVGTGAQALRKSSVGGPKFPCPSMPDFSH